MWTLWETGVKTFWSWMLRSKAHVWSRNTSWVAPILFYVEKVKTQFLGFIVAWVFGFFPSNTSLCILYSWGCVDSYLLLFLTRSWKIPKFLRFSRRAWQCGALRCRGGSVVPASRCSVLPKRCSNIDLTLHCPHRAVQQRQCWHNLMNSRGAARTWLNGQLLRKGGWGGVFGKFFCGFFPQWSPFFARQPSVMFFSLVGNRQPAQCEVI